MSGAVPNAKEYRRKPLLPIIQLTISMFYMFYHPEKYLSSLFHYIQMHTAAFTVHFIYFHLVPLQPTH